MYEFMLIDIVVVYRKEEVISNQSQHDSDKKLGIGNDPLLS